MFQNLKQHINKENLHALKKKSRYLEDQNESDLQQQNMVYEKLSKQTKSYQLTSKQQPNPFKHDKKNHDPSSDSLSDYQLQQRQEAFNRLVTDNQSLFSPLEKYKINFSDNYFTPQNKIQQLQRSAELSQQKIKLIQQFHARELSTLTEKHDRKLHQIQLETQKLQILINQTQNKDLRLKELIKENHNLKETLHNYEEKYWKFQEMEKLYHKTQTQKKVLKLQNLKLKQLIQSNQQTKQNQPGNYSKNLSQQANKHFSQQANKYAQQLQGRLKNSQRVVSNLDKKLSQAQHQTELDRLFYEEKLKSCERKIEELEQSLRLRQRLLIECERACEKLKQQKGAVEKSLVQTMQSFSKHLSNESAHNQLALLTRQINKQITYSSHKSEEKRQQRMSKGYEEATINLEQTDGVGNSYEEEDRVYEKEGRELHGISPVAVKKVSFYQPSYLPESQFNPPYQKERTRVMSYQLSEANNKVDRRRGELKRQSGKNQNDPEKRDGDRIMRLQKKLQAANQQIVKLLRQKLSWGIQNTHQIYYS